MGNQEGRMSIIAKELAALDAVIEGASALAQEALERKADLKQGRLASESYGRVNTAVKVRLESRLNQGRLIEIEAKLINRQPVPSQHCRQLDSSA
jgi:hypothetical protein